MASSRAPWPGSNGSEAPRYVPPHKPGGPQYVLRFLPDTRAPRPVRLLPDRGVACWSRLLSCGLWILSAPGNSWPGGPGHERGYSSSTANIIVSFFFEEQYYCVSILFLTHFIDKFVSCRNFVHRYALFLWIVLLTIRSSNLLPTSYEKRSSKLSINFKFQLHNYIFSKSFFTSFSLFLERTVLY